MGIQGLLNWNAVPPEALSAELAPPASGDQRSSPALGFLRDLVRFVPGGEVTVGLLLLVVVVGAFAGLAMALRRVPANRDAALATSAKQPAAVLGAVNECRWKSLLPESGISVEGKRLELVSGVAEFLFGPGTRVAVEGPARFEVLSPSRIWLERGKLIAAVPKAAAGFTVSTQFADVIDLGTEFGVEVDTAGKTDVHVLGVRWKSNVPPRAKPGSQHVSAVDRRSGRAQWRPAQPPADIQYEGLGLPQRRGRLPLRIQRQPIDRRRGRTGDDAFGWATCSTISRTCRWPKPCEPTRSRRWPISTTLAFIAHAITASLGRKSRPASSSTRRIWVGWTMTVRRPFVANDAWTAELVFAAFSRRRGRDSYHRPENGCRTRPSRKKGSACTPTPS